MASTTSGDDRAIPLADFAADIACRREQSGVPDLPRNSGTRRTASKNALLTTLKDIGARW